MASIASLQVVVRCADFDASLRFYHDLLGLPVVQQWDDPGNRGAILAAGGGATLEICRMNAADPRFHPGFLQPVPNDKIDLQLRADSVAGWMERLQGQWPFTGPELLPWGHRWIQLRDPDGLLIALWEPA
jgi:catechol 2,3-dioxygenase-like lactoylglutathione lyase family enzyme